jgi:hypothetical protein
MILARFKGATKVSEYSAMAAEQVKFSGMAVNRYQMSQSGRR